MFGRTLKASVAKDNGKSGEYQSRRTYSTNSYCFECQEEGHVSYKCPKNVLGIRDPPAASASGTRKRNPRSARSSRVEEVGDLESGEHPESSFSNNSTAAESFPIPSKRKRFTQDSYFSDEEEEICE